MNPPHDLTDKMLILNKTAPRYSELYSQTETTLCVVYLISASVIGLVMNFALIIATLNYKANKLDQASIRIVRHLAGSDILFVLLYMPQAIAWHLTQVGTEDRSTLLCLFLGCLGYLPMVANLFFILMFSLIRLFHCSFPLTNLSLSSNQSKIVTGSVWVIAFISSLVSTVINKFTAKEQILRLSCQLELDGEYSYFISTLVLLPFILIFLTYAGVIITSCRREVMRTVGTPSAYATVSTLIMTIVLFITWAPLITSFLLSIIRHHHFSPGLAPQKVLISKSGMLCYSVNLLVNPCMYSLLNRRFRKYVTKTIARLFRFRDQSSGGSYDVTRSGVKTLESRGMHSKDPRGSMPSPTPSNRDRPNFRDLQIRRQTCPAI